MIHLSATRKVSVNSDLDRRVQIKDFEKDHLECQDISTLKALLPIVFNQNSKLDVEVKPHDS